MVFLPGGNSAQHFKKLARITPQSLSDHLTRNTPHTHLDRKRLHMKMNLCWLQCYRIQYKRWRHMSLAMDWGGTKLRRERKSKFYEFCMSRIRNSQNHINLRSVWSSDLVSLILNKFDISSTRYQHVTASIQKTDELFDRSRNDSKSNRLGWIKTLQFEYTTSVFARAP